VVTNTHNLPSVFGLVLRALKQIIGPVYSAFELRPAPLALKGTKRTITNRLSSYISSTFKLNSIAEVQIYQRP